MARVTGIVFEVKDEATGTIKKIESEFISATTKMGNSSSQSSKKIADSNKDLVSSLTKVYFQVQILESLFTKFFQVPIAGFKTVTEEALKFEKSIAQISTLVDSAQIPTKQLNKEVAETAIAFGQDKIKTASAYYEILSSGAVDAADANKLLGVASKMAVAGGTEVDIAMSGLTTTMAAYGLKAESASDVSDAFFAAAAAGKTNIKELSHFIGESAAVASQAGIGYDELLAAIAAGSTTLGSTRFAVTGLNQAIQHILAPTESAKKEAYRLGIEFSAAGIQAKGLRQYLLDLVNAPNMTAASMKKLFESIEAVKLVSAITANEGKKFAETLVEVENRVGKTTEAFDKMAKTSEFLFQKMNTAFSLVQSKLGLLITETDTYKGIVEGITDSASTLQTLLGEYLEATSDPGIQSKRLATIQFTMDLTRAVIDLTEALKPMVRFFDFWVSLFDAVVTNKDIFTNFLKAIPGIGPIIGTQIDTINFLFEALNRSDFGSGAVGRLESIKQFLLRYHGDLSLITAGIILDQKNLSKAGQALLADFSTIDEEPITPKGGVGLAEPKEKKGKKPDYETEVRKMIATYGYGFEELSKQKRRWDAENAEIDAHFMEADKARGKWYTDVMAYQLQIKQELAKELLDIDRDKQRALKKIYEEDQRMYEEHSRNMENISRTLGSFFVEGGKSIIEGTKTIGDVFEDLLQMILTKVAEFLVSSAIQTFLMFITGGISGGFLGVLGSIFGGGILSPAYSNGGPVRGFASGGFVSGGMPNVDSVPALLTPGEFVLSKDVVNQIKQGRSSLTSNSNTQTRTTNQVQNTFVMNTLIPPTNTDFDRLIGDNVNPSLNRISKRGVVRRR